MRDDGVAAASRDYLVTVRVVETFTVITHAKTAKEAEERVRAGYFRETDASQNGDRKWTSVKARLDV